MQVIRIKNLTQHFDEKLKVLDNISLEVNKNDFITLVGPSGCGKSTLFKVITKLITNFDGEISINDTTLNDSTDNLGYMPQKDLLLPWRTLYKNVTLPLELAHKNIDSNDMGQLISIFGLSGFEKSYPHQLSGGMKQRAALLRTFLMGNEIILLDEPFAALDSLTKKKLQLWLVDVFKKMNKTVIFITHDIEEALTLSNRIIVLSKLPARIIEEFKIDEEYPRNYDVLNSNKFLSIKKKIIDLIE